MKRACTLFVAALFAMLLSAAFAAPAMAVFGFEDVEVGFANEDGSPANEAGSHPFEMRTKFDMNIQVDPEIGEIPDGEIKDLTVKTLEGLVGNPTAMPRCTNADFDKLVGPLPSCPNDTAVGYAALRIEFAAHHEGESDFAFHVPVYNLEPTAGEAAKLGFVGLTVPVTVDIGVSDKPPYNVVASLNNISQAILVYGGGIVLWGNPANPAHDPYRGDCLNAEVGGEEPVSLGECPVSEGVEEKPFLTLPRACTGSLGTLFSAVAWNTDARDEESAQTGGMDDCGELGFEAETSSQPTNQAAEGPTGLDFNLDIEDKGLSDPNDRAQSDVKKTVVTLPEGMTINPSQAEGLGVCTEDDLGRETADSAPGAGCPQSSKIGTVEVETPLLENEVLKGSLFVAAPYVNRFGSLIALYMTIKSPERGVSVALAGKVEPDPRTGRLTTTFDNLPQLPFSHFRLRFRGGDRSPLVTPPRCGDYTIDAVFTPWANPTTTFTDSSGFKVTTGVNGGPCPGGVAPFNPGFNAGTINNSGGSYSPLQLRLSRRDGEQEITRLDAVLPPGLVGKLAGVAKCTDAAIAAAGSKSGWQELAAPSCPASSQIGRVLAGAGVGPALTYVPGKIYLAGPFGGDPLSVVVITPAVAGPFDIGTVVIREALTVDPRTAEVQVDGASSSRIPHILAGIPLKLRDLRVHVDRDNFILNPTSCDPFALRATVFGSFLDALSPTDDVPVGLSSRFQAANCGALAFRPKLSLKLTGGTTRSDHPALQAVLDYPPGPGYANVGKAVVTLPHSAFLEQSHIRTVCTRVQFAAKQCPAGSIYGFARATTPLLDEPLEGPVYLRSSSNPLPDLVAALHGVIDVELVGRIDSVRGRIRTTFDSPPDAPVSKFVLNMRGGKRGLVVNSRNLCTHNSRAIAILTAQNGKLLKTNPLVTPQCGGKAKPGKQQKGR